MSYILHSSLFTLLAAQAHAQYDPSAPEPIGKFTGSLVIHGGGELPEEVATAFLELAGGPTARIVVIPTAGEVADSGDSAADAALWKDKGAASVEVLHTRDRIRANDPEFVRLLAEATGVWMGGGQQSRIAEAYLDTEVEQALYDLMDRGGVIGGTSAGAAAMSRLMIAGGNPVAEVARGFDLLPRAVVDQHFVARDRRERLLGVLAANPGLVGYGVDEGTAMIARGRTLFVVGKSSVTVCLAGSSKRPVRIDELHAGQFADLIALNRAALARAADPQFPPESPAPPEVAGSLVIVGGGGLPSGLFERFIELAGGPEAGIVYVPCVTEDLIADEPGIVEELRRAGSKNVTWIHTKDRRRANDDQEFLAPLKEAGGIWFGGGRQWNLVDSYQNTTAHRLMHEVLARGGAIGGSSAGASIQGDYMPRGNPLGNLDIMAEGYERGLGFLTGVAIDQHFAQRNRFTDMTSLVATYPQLLGIGLDEGTAIVVQGSTAEVIGENNVSFFDAAQPPGEDGHDYVSISEGGRYDLKRRQVIEAP